MKRILAKLLFIAIFSLPFFANASSPSKDGEFYQITVYHFANIAQQNKIEQYLKDAYLPALQRQGLKLIGVFTNIANDTLADKRLYVIYPIKSLQQVIDLASKLEKDIVYESNGKSYLDADFKNPPYSRMEKILLKSFPLAPFLNLPKLTSPKSERVYELRSYESATEKIHQNKVQMFNEGGEIDLFKQLNFNAIFYASVIVGSHMPNLMYMTSFENKADRDAHWKIFGESPIWNKIKSLPEYQNNVSKNEQNFLRATDYSNW